MKKLSVCMLVLMAASTCNASSTRADFYLSPNGSDGWSGTSAEPNAQGTDGPFATLERARDAVRDLKGSESTDIVVLVRGGTYLLEETVVFGLKDSGAGDATITYAAYPGETPVFSSGREIKGFKKVTGTLPGLPKEAQGKVFVANVSGRFHTLYDAEGLLPRARSAGFRTTAGGGLNVLNFPEGKLKNWPNVEDVEIIIRASHQWMVNILPLASVDEDTKIARTSIDATYKMKSLGESCWVENVLDELNEPGEWALNTKEGKVYLWPRGKSPVVAPQLLELIRVEGKIDEMGPTDVPVRNLCFRGLTFMHGARYLVDKDDAGVQHDWDMVDKDNALVRLRGAENCVVEKCHFLHSGSGAVRVDLYGQDNKISSNHIEHIGGTGILLGGYGPGTKDVSRKNLVYNNHIHHVGEIYWHSPGILLWQSGENRVANNLIHNTNYCGMIICGCVTKFITRTGREVSRSIRRHEVGQVEDLPANPTLDDVRPYLHSHDNLIEYNEIHHAMEKLGDGNGIYIRGSGAGNIIRRNYVHHLVAPSGAQSGIRTDGGQMDTLIAENLIYKCTSQGLILKLNNRAENNIIADIIDGQRQAKGTPVAYLRLVEGPTTGGAFKRNIIYHPGAKASLFIESRGAQAKDGDTDYNIYYCAGKPELSQAMLDKKQRDGVDAHSLAVDPLFVDPENGDFRFAADSPALKMGIVPIDISEIGLRTEKPAAVQIEPTWKSLAANYQVPQWLVDGKIGVWMHWGISSAADENRPNDGSWYGRNMYGGGKAVAKTLCEWHTQRYGPPSEFGYEKMIPLFKGENWDPDALVKFVKDNGARFVMPVACHHDNFDMYDSFHPWNSLKMGPKRDTLKEWKEAATKHGLKFGVSTHLYWSPGWFRPARKHQKPGTLEWKLFNMDYDTRGFSTQDSWNEHWYARCWEIIEKYDPDLFNHDCGTYPKIGGGKGLGIKLFTAFINRDLKENNGKQTVVFSTKDAKLDRSAFTYNLERGGAGEIKPEPWIWATDLSGGWFYRATAVNKMSIPVMVANGVDAISKNGVVMLNIALRGDGTIPEKQAAYLTAFGDFLRINGEGIYGTRPWKTFGEGPLKVKDGRQGENHAEFSQEDIRFTTKDGVLYAFVLAPPTEDIVIRTLATGGLLDREISGIELMGSDEKIRWNRSADALTIQLPQTLPGQIVNGFRIQSK